ncbi:MAG TPA: rhodanese-like domain-containing protein [Clostridiaceae bacterium]|nr:rhodanese-like domain-containing protein [Clostridiaceae bacterium]
MAKIRTNIFTILLLAAVLIAATACSKETDTDISFDALTLSSGTSLMMDAKGNEYLEQIDLISVWLPEGEEYPPVGSLVNYKIEGEIMESYPPQVWAISLEIVKVENEPTIISLDLAEKIKEHQPQDTVILDVRTAEEFAEGHVPDATSLPLADLEANIPSYYNDNATLIVYCQGPCSSAHAAELLSEAGFDLVFDAGGIESYSGELVTD